MLYLLRVLGYDTYSLLLVVAGASYDCTVSYAAQEVLTRVIILSLDTLKATKDFACRCVALYDVGIRSLKSEKRKSGGGTYLL